jgi:hypothetical protein
MRPCSSRGACFVQSKILLEASTDSQKGASAIPESTDMGNFDAAEMLAYLENEGIDDAVLAFCGNKRKAIVLYSRFMNSPNFEPWLHRIVEASDVPAQG